MTPAQLNVCARANVKRRQEEQQIAQANIYSLASLIRSMVWSKNPPGFDQVFPEAKTSTKKQEEMTDDAMYVMVKKLNALFGGEEVD